jgi:hypothetical protein
MGNEDNIKPRALVKSHLSQLPQRCDVMQQVTGFTVSDSSHLTQTRPAVDSN